MILVRILSVGRAFHRHRRGEVMRLKPHGLFQVSIRDNRPFPSSRLPPLQSESRCEVFLMKISFHSYVK